MINFPLFLIQLYFPRTTVDFKAVAFPYNPIYIVSVPSNIKHKCILMHNFTACLLESGPDLQYIQELLGHKSSKTTEIYIHVSKSSISEIISPVDKLKEKGGDK